MTNLEALQRWMDDTCDTSDITDAHAYTVVMALIKFYEQMLVIATDSDGQDHGWGDVAELFSDDQVCILEL